MEKTSHRAVQTPRIILHGGAGHITRENLPPQARKAYEESMRAVLRSAYTQLSRPDATALDVAVHAVSLLEDDPLFNCGKGAVFTRAGTNELEASVMVSEGFRKRGVGCMLLRRVKNPIKLAREMLVRGEMEDGGGAGGHSQLSGKAVEDLARRWGCEMVDPMYFYTDRRWNEHKRGLKKEARAPEPLTLDRTQSPESTAAGREAFLRDEEEYLPQGTVGAVVLDRFGTICVATSTGGLTNKLPGRIGDTPTLGAGFWAEKWDIPDTFSDMQYSQTEKMIDHCSRGNIPSLLDSCFSFSALSSSSTIRPKRPSLERAVGMSGTGNGDSFLRTNACRTVAAMARFGPKLGFQECVTAVAGRGGELERSAGERFGKTGEGDGGIIGIERVGTQSRIVFDFNCGGMFRAWVDDMGNHKFMVFKDE